MSQKTPDRRVQRTRKQLQDALIALVAEKGYEAVTVQEILDQANVGRSTFYAHFQDKDQLLRSILDQLDELFEQHNQRLLEATRDLASTGTTELMEDSDLTLSFFEFAGQHQRFFKAMLANRGYGIFVKPIYDYVFAHVHQLFTQPVHRELFARLHGPFKMQVPAEKYGALESEIAAHYFVSAFMGILVWWVEHDMPCTAAEIDRLLKELALPGFRRVLEANHQARIAG
jgi:AcrR family transcriptional regulator